MIKKTFTMTIIILLISLILVGCGTDNGTDLKTAEEKIEGLKKEYSDLEAENKILEKQIEELGSSNPTSSSSHINLVDFSLDVMNSLKDNDMNELSSFVHPSKGLRFTPYTYVDIQNDKLFTAGEVAGLNGDSTVYTWGDYDGSGDSIDLKFSDYYNEFVYNQDFINPHLIGNNTTIGTGNMINNISTVYPNGSFVEFHFTGFDPQYTGIDWASLTLVFEQDGVDWYLVGIIHGQWTI